MSTVTEQAEASTNDQPAFLQRLRQQRGWLYVAAGFAAGLVAEALLQQFNADPLALVGDFLPQIVGVVLTIVILDRLNERRQRRAEVRQERARLIHDLGSKLNALAVKAAEEMRDNGMLFDGALVRAGLSWANLQHVNLLNANLVLANLSGAVLTDAILAGANLTEANLWKANLAGADLLGADLTGAYLMEANLVGADMWNANLPDAKLWDANLSEVNMFRANLAGANLWRANLAGANLTGVNLVGTDVKAAVFDENTQLPDTDPDGEIFYWTSHTDMSRYTDPAHPDFWQPTWVHELNGG